MAQKNQTLPCRFRGGAAGGGGLVPEPGDAVVTQVVDIAEPARQISLNGREQGEAALAGACGLLSHPSRSKAISFQLSLRRENDEINWREDVCCKDEPTQLGRYSVVFC
jgi:hypothetical protein